jgi:hypothetical protein
MMPTNLPIACSLSDAALQQREADLLARFRSEFLAIAELASGYALKISGEDRCLQLVADLMQAERECCPFLTFELTAEPAMGPLTLSITGPDGTKDFLKTVLFKG